jgi:hypothetical protein
MDLCAPRHQPHQQCHQRAAATHHAARTKTNVPGSTHRADLALPTVAPAAWTILLAVAAHVASISCHTLLLQIAPSFCWCETAGHPTAIQQDVLELLQPIPPVLCSTSLVHRAGMQPVAPGAGMPVAIRGDQCTSTAHSVVWAAVARQVLRGEAIQVARGGGVAAPTATTSLNLDHAAGTQLHQHDCCSYWLLTGCKGTDCDVIAGVGTSIQRQIMQLQAPKG